MAWRAACSHCCYGICVATFHVQRSTKLLVVGFMESNAEEWFWLGMMANPKNMDEGFADNIILVGCTHYIMSCGFIHFD